MDGSTGQHAPQNKVTRANRGTLAWQLTKQRGLTTENLEFEYKWRCRRARTLLNKLDPSEDDVKEFDELHAEMEAIKAVLCG